jgi:hypothetical protein
MWYNFNKPYIFGPSGLNLSCDFVRAVINDKKQRNPNYYSRIATFADQMEVKEDDVDLGALLADGNRTALYDAVAEVSNLLSGFAQFIPKVLLTLLTDGRDNFSTKKHIEELSEIIQASLKSNNITFVVYCSDAQAREGAGGLGADVIRYIPTSAARDQEVRRHLNYNARPSHRNVELRELSVDQREDLRPSHRDVEMRELSVDQREDLDFPVVPTHRPGSLNAGPSPSIRDPIKKVARS